jgi:plastocyanin
MGRFTGAGGRAFVVAAALLLHGSSGRPPVPVASVAAAAPTDHRVMMDSSAFVPRALSVKLGDAVVWTNSDPFPHTATSVAGQFDSKRVLPGRSWTYHATRKGTFEYVCSLHPGMTGTLTVE